MSIHISFTPFDPYYIADKTGGSFMTKDISKIDYSSLDQPEILNFLFHPRKDYGPFEPDSSVSGTHFFIPVEEGIQIGACFYTAAKDAPNILFFHGNGEIVSDYADFGPLYINHGINFLPVDYRGYGRSTGTPTITAMIRDAHVIFNFTVNRLKEDDCTGPLIVMGRSLGSASALEIASHYKDRIDGLIMESGFAFDAPLFQLLGADVDAIGINEKKGFQNKKKIGSFDKPLLVIHAEYDHIIPFTDGLALYDACPAEKKAFLKIKGANHNDIFMRGLNEYMEAVNGFAKNLKR